MPIEALNDQDFETITFEDICGAIANQIENEVFDIKRTVTSTSRDRTIDKQHPAPVSIEKIVKIITSFMNGSANNPYGYIFIGIAEKEDGTPNLENFYPVSFGKNTFTSMKEGESSKKKFTTKCSSAEDFITKIYMARYYNPSNMQKPVYYDYEDTIPAVPELTVLFDAVYFGNLNKIQVLLEQRER